MKFYRGSGIAIISLVLLSLLIFTSCSCSKTIGYSGSNTGSQIRGSYHLFNGTKSKTIQVTAGKTTVIIYASVVEEGKLEIELKNTVTMVTTTLPSNTTGIKTITAVNNEKYQLVITGTQTKGSFDINWKEQ
jgi:hypothetical protein